MPADAAAKIARACNVSIDWLLRGEGPMEYLPVGHVTADGAVVEQGPVMPIRPDLAASIDTDRATQALQLADAIFALIDADPTPKQRVQAMAILYDHLPELLRELNSKNRKESELKETESQK